MKKNFNKQVIAGILMAMTIPTVVQANTLPSTFMAGGACAGNGGGKGGCAAVDPKAPVQTQDNSQRVVPQTPFSNPGTVSWVDERAKTGPAGSNNAADQNRMSNQENVQDKAATNRNGNAVSWADESGRQGYNGGSNNGYNYGNNGYNGQENWQGNQGYNGGMRAPGDNGTMRPAGSGSMNNGSMNNGFMNR